MEKFSDKIGLYDIWTVIFPGVVCLIGVRSIYNFMVSLSESLSITPGIAGKVGLILRINITIPRDIYELFALFAFSYICGLVLQELSSILKHNIIYKTGDPRALLLDKTAGILNEHELDRLLPVFKRLNNGKDFLNLSSEELKEESTYLFHRINKHLQDQKKSNEYVKLNVIYNVCYTLCVVLMLFGFIISSFAINYFFCEQYPSALYSLMLLCIIGVLFWILFSKGKRFYRYWVRNIVFTYEELCGNNCTNSN
ncbi:hypothetical protein [Flintibacter porci]|uniref:hypothetical protein n=1 Tax=Flintibacter porci TaxID=3342383 RepID=UPI003F8CB425